MGGTVTDVDDRALEAGKGVRDGSIIGHQTDPEKSTSVDLRSLPCDSSRGVASTVDMIYIPRHVGDTAMPTWQLCSARRSSLQSSSP